MRYDTHNTLTSRSFWLGAALWGIVSITAVAASGPVWDESFEHAQVLRGDVSYPDGHPMRQYLFEAYSVQHYTTAALMSVTSNPVWMCGFRGALSLALTTIPLFLLAAALSGRALLGHVAVLVALFGAFKPFASTYPIVVWWSSYSNGQIGQGFALLTLAMLSLRRWRTAALLAGILPAIHLGHWPPVFGVMLVAACVAWWSGERAQLARCAGIFAVGLAACAVFAVIQRMLAPALPEDGIYALHPTAEAIEDVWRGFTFCADGDRALPPRVAVVAAVLPMALGGLLMRLRRQDPAWAVDAAWPWAYAAGTAVVVTLIALTQLRMGDATPILLVSWMPYRLLNHLPFVTAALAMAALATAPNRTLSANLAMATLAVALSPPLGRGIGGAWVGPYVGGGEGVLFVLVGMALATLMMTASGRDQLWCVTGLIVSIAVVATAHRFGAACLALGAVLPWSLSRLDGRATGWVRAAAAVTCMTVLLHALMSWRAGMIQGPQLPDQLEPARTALSAVAAPGDLIIGHPSSHTLQSRLGQPVHCDAAILSLISYKPRIGPLIEQMFEDGYGISIARSRQGEVRPHWTEVWQARSRDEWIAFREKYGVRFVLAPPEAQPLDLPMLDADLGIMRDVLYEIPTDSAGQSTTTAAPSNSSTAWRGRRPSPAAGGRPWPR